jgi:hypothetical protein
MQGARGGTYVMRLLVTFVEFVLVLIGYGGSTRLQLCS